MVEFNYQNDHSVVVPVFNIYYEYYKNTLVTQNIMTTAHREIEFVDFAGTWRGKESI